MASETVFSIIGARPHFVKAAPFMQAMRASSHRVFTIHSGQHYDTNMSDIFFQQLNMPEPDVNLGVGSGSHAYQTAEVMKAVEDLILEMKPKAVVVFGDTNTTLGAALAAAKQYVQVIHIEAGVRCGNRHMPEEINRSLIDDMSDVLACPSDVAIRNLENEGKADGAINIGDFMYDTFLGAQEETKRANIDLSKYGIKDGRYMLSTLHREEATASAERLSQVLATLGDLGDPLILPMHPRTRALLEREGIAIERSDGLRIIEPVGYIEMVGLLNGSKMVLTDSGGLQKEAFWAGKPCVTLMKETAWVETIEIGWNILTGLDPERIRQAVSQFNNTPPEPPAAVTDLYGEAGAAERLVKHLGWV